MAVFYRRDCDGCGERDQVKKVEGDWLCPKCRFERRNGVGRWG